MNPTPEQMALLEADVQAYQDDKTTLHREVEVLILLYFRQVKKRLQGIKYTITGIKVYPLIVNRLKGLQSLADTVVAALETGKIDMMDMARLTNNAIAKRSALERKINPAEVPLNPRAIATVREGAITAIQTALTLELDRVKAVLLGSLRTGLISNITPDLLEQNLLKTLEVSEKRLLPQFIEPIQEATNTVIQLEAQQNNRDTYLWWTQLDGRVRSSHQDLHGTVRRWDEGILPGEERGCRCIALPVPN